MTRTLAATVLTIIGVPVGVRFALTGSVSRSGDLVYHAALFGGLVATTGLLLGARTHKVRDDDHDLELRIALNQ